MNPRINSDRIVAQLAQLATYSDSLAPSVTRIVFTDADLRARAYVKSLANDLDIREDAVGNTFFRWTGSEPQLPAVCTGSHIDAIPNAGMYDGTVGVIGGLEAIRSLQEGGFRPRRSIELLLFTSEEPTRFGIGCLGSRLLCGGLPPQAGETLRDKDGVTLNEARAQAGFTGSVEEVRLAEGHYSAFVELHIEQGPLLEREGCQTGIVTAIAAPASLRIAIEGEGGHAGAVLMPDRHDAFLAAAEIALAAEHAARSTGAPDTVATCGVCNVFPGAVNSIPSRVQLELDIRDTDRARRDMVMQQLRSASEEVSLRRGVRLHTDVVNADDPGECGADIIEALTHAAKAANVSHRLMVSRAYHDSLFLSRIAPTAMLFIPCRNGWSHRPDEYASTAAIAAGALVLARAIADLST